MALVGSAYRNKSEFRTISASDVLDTFKIAIFNPETTEETLSTISSLSEVFQIENVVYVEQESNFGTAVGGEIILANANYVINVPNVLITNTLVLPTGALVQISSTNSLDRAITYLGTGDMFRGDPTRLFIENIGMLAVPANMARLFNITTTAPFGVFSQIQTRAIGFGDLGAIDGIFIIFRNIGFIVNFDGLKLKNIAKLPGFGGSSFQDINFQSQSGNAVEVSGVTDVLTMNNVVYAPSTGDAVYDFDSGITTTKIIVTNTFFNSVNGGTFFAAGSLDQTDVRFRMRDNAELADSAVIGSAFFNGNTTETVIASAGVPVKIVGTTAPGNLERFTHTNGRLTYIGLEPIILPLQLRATIKIDTSLETSTIATHIFKNGSIESSTIAVQEITSAFQTPTSPEFVSVDNILMEKDDFFEGFIENQTDAANITVTESKLITNG